MAFEERIPWENVAALPRLAHCRPEAPQGARNAAGQKRAGVRQAPLPRGWVS